MKFFLSTDKAKECIEVFDFCIISDLCEIGWNIPGWLLGFASCGLYICFYKKLYNFKFARITFQINAVFCLVVVLLDLLMLYVSSQI